MFHTKLLPQTTAVAHAIPAEDFLFACSGFIFGTSRASPLLTIRSILLSPMEILSRKIRVKSGVFGISKESSASC